MRAPSDSIAAPPLPVLEWVNVAMLRMDQQVGRPVLVEFWDFCRINSLRTLPYVKAWHARYAEFGLRVIGLHAGAYPPSSDPTEVREAVARLGVEYAVGLDAEFRAWKQFDVPGWPARYLFDPRLRLFEYHHGEGGYAETERAIGELLGVDVEPVPALRPEDAPGVLLVEPTRERPGAYSGLYGAGGVHAVLSGSGELRVGSERIAVEHAGVVTLVEHPVHTEALLELEAGPGVEVHATQFTPGLDPDGAASTKRHRS
ncbi:MAG: DipZ protein [Actinomycetota bacterium]|nr:DipZ protein [Actinomycetota bacterium]